MSGHARCIGPRCNARAVQAHHVIYRQHIRQAGGDERDPRSTVPVCVRCHERTHSGIARLPLWVLPDEAFEFAFELLGPASYDYLKRRYSGSDDRLELLIGGLA